MKWNEMNGCNLLKGKGSAYYASIGYKIVIIQIESYSAKPQKSR